MTLNLSYVCPWAPLLVIVVVIRTVREIVIVVTTAVVSIEPSTSGDVPGAQHDGCERQPLLSSHPHALHLGLWGKACRV